MTLQESNIVKDEDTITAIYGALNELNLQLSGLHALHDKITHTANSPIETITEYFDAPSMSDALQHDIASRVAGIAHEIAVATKSIRATLFIPKAKEFDKDEWIKSKMAG